MPRFPENSSRRGRLIRLSTVMLTALAVLGCANEEVQPDPDADLRRDPLLRAGNYAETAPARFQVSLETSAGHVLIDVHRRWAPIGADRFYSLVRGGYYNDARIYRVVEGFMAQFGLNGNPYVNQVWKSEFLVDDPVIETNSRGRIAFAKGGRHSRTTEVFISYKDNKALDEEGFSPFGEVIEGMDVVDAFYDGYGDGPPRGDGPYQAMAAARGNAYLDTEFPALTRITLASIYTQN